MTFCYCIVDHQGASYLDQAALSITFLKATQKNPRVILVTDALTYDIARQNTHHVIPLIDEYRIQDYPDANPVEISRYLKINVRHWVNGEFIFIDADTIPIASLESKLFADNLAIGPDVWFIEDPAGSPTPLRKWYKELNWKFPSTYSNSGFIYFPNTPLVTEIVTEWFDKWKEFVGFTGKYYDQPALNATIAGPMAEGKITILPHCYNAPITAVHTTLKRALNLHFLSDEELTVHADMTKRLAQSKYLPEDVISNFIAHPYPWKEEGRISAHIQTREYAKAFYYLIQRLKK